MKRIRVFLHLRRAVAAFGYFSSTRLMTASTSWLRVCVVPTILVVARLIYTMLTKGGEYTDQGQDYFEERYRERVLRQLSQRANKMGMKLVAVEQPA
jgi:hypothetical protein